MTWQWNRIVRTVSLLAVGLTFGLLLSAGLRTTSRSSILTSRVDAVPSGTGAGSIRIRSSIERLEAEQQDLRSVLSELRRQHNTLQESAAANAEQLALLQREVQKQRLLAGLTPAVGPGVIITLDDSPAQPSPRDNPNRYLIHDYNLRDIVNLLWLAGSEAIAINNERLVGTTSIYCVGSTILVNNTRLSPPYVIRAVGNPRLQQDYLRNPSYLQDLREMQRLHGLRLDVQSTGRVTLPEHSGGFLVEHARPGD